uniref:ras-related GTP-binding protein D isoform X4 n=1 Tax=Gasterosteus aculeatus aculeatus TaxID=481459 RepID=UPI001A99DC27|nr:ras-related GTP-binding protein D isoform X4 [Gasterosteus aculeatus aculeatus]
MHVGTQGRRLGAFPFEQQRETRDSVGRARRVKVHRHGSRVSGDNVGKAAASEPPRTQTQRTMRGGAAGRGAALRAEEPGDEDSAAAGYYDDAPGGEDGVLGFSDSLNGEVKPRILLMGMRRSGKSSIQKVVFHKMSPNETLFLESTNKICREDVSSSSFVSFQIWDFPGQIDFFDPTFDYEMIFRGTGALIFVIDSQDDYVEALSRLHLTVTRAYKVNPEINFEVFIHKVDGLSDDNKIEKQRDIQKRASDDLADAALEHIHLSFYLTSIYDHSIFEAFSKVVQKLIPQLPTLENLLNIFISNSGIEKAFLFDVVSKINIATDSSPVDMQTYELCCDMIDVVIDISCIYGLTDSEAGLPYDEESMAIIHLNNTTVMYLKEVTKFLAIVCFVRKESFERKGFLTNRQSEAPPSGTDRLQLPLLQESHTGGV